MAYILKLIFCFFFWYFYLITTLEGWNVKKWIFMLFIVFSRMAFGQELLLPEMTLTDSAEMKIEREIMYRQLLSGTFMSTDLVAPLPVPEWNYNSGLVKQWSFVAPDRSVNSFHWNGIPEFAGMPSSFFVKGSVLQLNNRFLVGGYSFGAKSVFTAPFPNQGLNSYDVRGSSLYFKYDVSKNFKIETRINVTQGPGPGF